MLSEQEIRLYARQVILRELGQAGQARLCASRVAVADGVARDYLQRAGMQVDLVDGLPVELPDMAQLDEPALQACADWLAGAWAAVETIKRVAGVGNEAKAAPALWTAEVD